MRSAESMARCLTSPCSRRAAARRAPRREISGPRPAAEGQVVMRLSQRGEWVAVVSRPVVGKHGQRAASMAERPEASLRASALSVPAPFALAVVRLHEASASRPQLAASYRSGVQGVGLDSHSRSASVTVGSEAARRGGPCRASLLGRWAASISLITKPLQRTGSRATAFGTRWPAAERHVVMRLSQRGGY